MSRITSDTNSARKSCQTKRVRHFTCFWEEIAKTEGGIARKRNANVCGSELRAKTFFDGDYRRCSQEKLLENFRRLGVIPKNQLQKLNQIPSAGFFLSRISCVEPLPVGCTTVQRRVRFCYSGA